MNLGADSGVFTFINSFLLGEVSFSTLTFPIGVSKWDFGLIYLMLADFGLPLLEEAETDLPLFSVDLLGFFFLSPGSLPTVCWGLSGD